MAKQLVLAFFESEAAADEAVAQLKDWDRMLNTVKLGAIGVLVKDEKGKIKTNKLGARRTGSGALLLGLAAALTGGAALLAGVAGAAVGGIVGSFFHKGLGLSKEDLARIDAQLDGGKAAVGVLADPENVSTVTGILEDSGGTTESHEVADEAIAEAARASAEEGLEDTPEEPAG